MAAAAPSPLASTVEKTNGAKLSRLLIDGGTTVLRKIFDRHHPPANLLAALNTNYHTLNNLLRRRVLHKPQWDLLFPPGGATPDSNTFDITLLFLLLTHICGLSPPLSGWHTKPPPSDTSVEANLACIKFFRNQLYGHVTTTGIDAPTFSALWREISAVLIALGLPQGEIDRLKAERCGEEDFIDVLSEWADSEEDIRSQLKVIHQSQSKLQQTIDEAHLTQLEYRKILQDSKRKLGEIREVQTEARQTVDELRQSQSKTQQTVDEVHLTQLEDHEILQNSKTKLEEVHEVQTKTQQIVDEVRQSQLEDRGTIQDSNVKLQMVFQIDRKTHQVVTNVRETQIDDSKAIQKMSQSQTNTERGVAKLLDRQEEFHLTLQETKSRIEDTHKKLLRTQSEHFEATRQDLKQAAEDLEGQREKHRENEILKKLAKIDTVKNVRHHADRYVEGTRLSIFAKVESWLIDRSSPNRVMVISGNAGMGKSVISAVMCEKMQKVGRLAGSHFCQHDRARHRNPKVMLQSLASHLCDFLPDYKKALVEKLSRNLGVEINNMEVKDLFDVLFEEPLTSLNDPGLTYLMVIDGLDESQFQGRNELLEVIANYFQSLPLWIRFLVTTRPERNITGTLKNLHPLQLDPNVEENVKDIHLCFEKQISHLLQSEHRENILQALVQKSEGVMLYAHYLVDFIKKEVPVLTLEALDSILPSGISSVYHSYFKRLETELCKELNVMEDQFLTFLSAVAAAREPLPLGFVSKLLLPGKSTSVPERKVKAAIASVSALLPVQDECIHFFHKSVKDWLIEKSYYGHHHFSVAAKEGHEVLSKLCINELDYVKRNGVDCTQFSDTAEYALLHGVQHMLQLEDARVCSLEQVATKYVLDVELVYAKLCVDVTAASEDIVCLQKQADVKELLGKCHRALNSLLLLLRKHIDTLEKVPHTIFQTLLNEGGDQFSTEASRLLESKYSEIAYMEYLQKDDLQGGFRTKFDCSAAVACFDVSSQLDYMVCECVDRTIQLWSLHTCKQLWKQDVKVEKDYDREEGDFFPYDTDPDYEPYRPSLTNGLESFYRSVVFHPTEDLVLPGILSHAYTFDGDVKPLFLSSKCRFSVCSISADKIKMLTNCPNDGKLVIMWSLKDGSEINRFTWKCEISSFAWSRDARLLAISDHSGSITLVDAMAGFKTLALTALSVVCGIIKFSPDCRCLYCLHSGIFSSDLFLLDVNMKNNGNFSLDILPDELSYNPWEFESCCETGFLLGDPFCWSPEIDSFQRTPAFVFVLNKQSVLRVSSCRRNVIEMLNLDELTKDSAGDSKTTVMEVVLSLNGNTLYVITGTIKTPATLKAWDISSGMFKAEKNDFDFFGVFTSYILVALREGVLLKTSRDTLELWNFELSECIRSWTDLGDISKVIAISEKRVACDAQSKVVIVDTTKEGIVSTINVQGKFITCNSKCHVMTSEYDDEGEYEGLQMQCGDQVLWKIYEPTFREFKTFSPSEQYCVLADNEGFCTTLYVFDVLLGQTLHMLCSCTRLFGARLYCKFVSEEECVTCFGDEMIGGFLQLFNVKSGDLLSKIALESYVYSLAACLPKRLIAIGFQNSKVNIKLLQVKLPQDEDSKKRKR